MPSGTAVSASAALCRVSPSSATDPEAATTTAWASAVTARTASEIHSARMPCSLASRAASARSAASCEWGRITGGVPEPTPPAGPVRVRRSGPMTGPVTGPVTVADP